MIRSTLVFFLVLIGSAVTICAQRLECFLSVDSSISSYIKEWQDADAVAMRVRNTTDSTIHFVIETTVALDGHALATTAHGKRRFWSMSAGQERVFHCADLLPLQSVYFTDRTRMDRTTGRITVKGDMRVCVAVLDTLTIRSYALPMCVQRTIIPYTEPECELPANQSVVAAGTPVHLSWKAVAPLPRHTEYRLRIYQCDSAQFVAQAVRTNDAILDTALVNSTRADWLPPKQNATMQNSSIRYAWHVFASDGKGTEYGMSTGYSAPAEFSVSGTRINKKLRGGSSSKKTSSKHGK